ncbi:FAD-dependent oxidoreductase [Pseudonocardia sp. NPDC049635]|uniref:FAD-dependent oxidoreductase n=1 Tax=Pseudonocardia sp. NPDC049635 TaxID=3155506 RepID=UPI0033F8E7B3
MAPYARSSAPAVGTTPPTWSSSASGCVPATTFAREAGLAAANGIVVDEHLRTSDPSIFAVGDCARFPLGPDGVLQRFEAVQNATDQGTTGCPVCAPASAAPRNGSYGVASLEKGKPGYCVDTRTLLTWFPGSRRDGRARVRPGEPTASGGAAVRRAAR